MRNNTTKRHDNSQNYTERKHVTTVTSCSCADAEEAIQGKTVKCTESNDTELTIEFTDGTVLWLNFENPEFEHFNIGWKAE